MTLKEHLDEINKLIESNPEVGNFPIIYSSDDEGNSYQPVWFKPTLVSVINLDQSYLEITNKGKANAVCIN